MKCRADIYPSDKDTDMEKENYQGEDLNIYTHYEYIVSQLEIQIDQYLDDVNILWDEVILEYKNDFSHAVIIDKLDRQKFFDLMTKTPTFISLINTHKRLLKLAQKRTG